MHIVNFVAENSVLMCQQENFQVAIEKLISKLKWILLLHELYGIWNVTNVHIYFRDKKKKKFETKLNGHVKSIPKREYSAMTQISRNFMVYE